MDAKTGDLKAKGGKRPGITMATLTCFDDMPQYHRLKTVARGRSMEFTPPEFHGDQDCIDEFSDSVIPSLEVEQPEISIHEIYEAQPIPASNIILHAGKAGHHRWFDAEKEVCMFELFGKALVDPDAKKIAFKPKFHPIRFGEALSLHGQCAGNYAHFLAEVLPKLLVADEYGDFPDAPILLDDGWTPINHRKLISLFNRHGRDIIRVGMDQAADVHRLFDISPTAYAPPEYRWHVEKQKMQVTPPEVYRFSRDALNLVRNFDLKKKLLKSPHGAKLFLGRRVTEFTTGRDLVNMHQLAHMAASVGFEAINTGDMGVLEQIATFRAARVVIAPIGASLSNLIFTPPGCEVICLSPIYDKANFYYFAKLMAVLGHKLTYVVGPQIEGSNPHPFHKNYSIDPDEFAQQLARVSGAKSRFRSRFGF